MIPVNSVVDEIPARLDPESAEWIRVLAVAGPQREAALARLHGMLLRIAQREARRRGPRVLIAGPELEDLAYQAAADALLAITGGPRWAGEPFYGRVRACPGKAGGPTAGGAELPSRATGQGPADLTIVG
jgi:hypothetical protein